MNKIRLLIVDDEPLAHKVLEGYCEKLDFIEIVGNCYDGISTLNFLNKTSVDAVLLDIQMPDLTGLELLDSLKSNSPKIIFTTAFTEYAIQGFDYDQVVDYLHKPIRISRFIKALERLKRTLLLEREFSKNPSLHIEEEKASPSSKFISLKDNKIIYRIPYTDILYIQSWGNYLKFFLKDKNIKLARKTIKVLEAELPKKQFIRTHKSYIVNINQVNAIEGNQIKVGDISLPIGKLYSMNVRKSLKG